MQDLVKRLDSMSPEQRRALHALLRTRGADFNVFPLSYGQQRVWFLSAMYEGMPIYTVPYGFWLRGNLDVNALGRALRSLVRRHDSLRTVYFDVDGEPYQTILQETSFCLGVRRWRPQDAEREDLVHKLLDAEARRNFDLRHGPLLSANVLTTGGDKHLLLLTLHHIACDGWSMAIIFRELEELYAAAVQGREPVLPPVPLRMVDYARWQREILSGPRREQLLDYWRTALAGAPETIAWTDVKAGSVTHDRAGELEITVWPPALARSVETASRRESATPFMTLLAIFAEQVRRRTGMTDFVLGTPMTERNQLELEGVVGFLVNTLPMRLRPSPDLSFRDLLRQVREVTVGAQAHRDIPFDMIVEALAADRSARNPLFQMSFVIQEDDTEVLRLPGLDVSIVHGHGGTTKFDINAAFTLLDYGLKCAIEYDPAMFDRGYIQQLLTEMRALLTAAIDAPDRPMSTLSGEVSG